MNEEEVVSGEVEAEADHMEVSTYLARIGFEEKPNTSLDCLARLQAAHQHAVPYENLDVFLGRKKVLDVGELYKRMVVKGRGGWCCELNGLFCWLLQKVGFVVRMVSASYYMEEKQKYKEEFDHLALIVTISEQVETEHNSKSHHYPPLVLEVGCGHHHHHHHHHCHHHMQEYLVDVGWGQANQPLAPIRLVSS